MATENNRLIAAIVLLAGAGFLAFGGYLLWTPIDGLAQFGLALPDDAVHRIEMRAFYGGLEMGLGLLLIKFALNAKYQRSGLWLVIASYGGVGFVRLTALMADGVYPRMMLYALAVELAFTIVAVWLLLRQKVSVGNGA